MPSDSAIETGCSPQVTLQTHSSFPPLSARNCSGERLSLAGDEKGLWATKCALPRLIRPERRPAGPASKQSESVSQPVFRVAVHFAEPARWDAVLRDHQDQVRLLRIVNNGETWPLAQGTIVSRRNDVLPRSRRDDGRSLRSM